MKYTILKSESGAFKDENVSLYRFEIDNIENIIKFTEEYSLSLEAFALSYLLRIGFYDQHSICIEFNDRSKRDLHFSAITEIMQEEDTV